jgi:uncharacterized protein
MRFLDTNVIIRFLTGDDPQKAQACRDLLLRVQRGEEQVRISEAIVTEVCYILSSRAHYRLSHEDIRQRLAPIVNLRGLKLPRKRLYLRALDLFATYPAVDFEDVLSAACMEAQAIEEFYSYDTDFDVLPAVKRLEP